MRKIKPVSRSAQTGDWHALLSLMVTQYCFLCCSSSNLQRTVKIGALVDFNSTTGQVAMRTIRLAVQDINKHNIALNGSKLELHMFDTGSHNPTLGAAAAVELLKNEVVAVVGPQYSSQAQFLAHMGASTNVPFVTFGAKDPNLSEFQYPFLIRLTHNDRSQMQAVAALIANYLWRNVAALYIDDDYGTNGITSLSDALQVLGSKVEQKIPLAPWVDSVQIGEILERLDNTETRVFVVHTPQDLCYQILSKAQSLNMVSAEYVWIVTDLIATDLGRTNLERSVIRSAQGIVGTRRYIAQSGQLKFFLFEWNRRYSPQEMDPNQLNTPALYAYDAVWTLALAISRYLEQKEGFTFIDPPRLAPVSGGESELARMRVFEGGSRMRKLLLQTNFSGITGLISFDERGDLQDTAFEYVNMIGKSPKVVGYWTSQSGILSPDRQSFAMPRSAQNPSSLYGTIQLPIVWPGGDSNPPRGWTLPKSGKPLKIAVPQKAGYNEIVSKTVDANNFTVYSGFCIKVFEAALNHLPYAVPYTFEGLTTRGSTPDYDGLVDKLARKEYDAVVGDVTITAERLRKVDFTQPYIESGLVVLVRVKNIVQKNRWAFLRPFTSTLWSIVLLFFIFTGIVIWILEHRMNVSFRGHPKKQIVTILTFTFSTLVFAQKEDARSALGRLALVVWLFVVMIISSSYTANLSSILTVEHLTPTIQGLESLLQSHLPIGYQTGSFVKNYLTDLHVSPDKLRNLTTQTQYQTALDLWPGRGGVAGIVDELPYIQLFLSHESCQNYTTAGSEFTKSGWGFVFPKESELTADFSKAILEMSQNGELQEIRDFWFGKQDCEAEAIKAGTQSSQLDVKSFEGLFLITGVASGFCVLIYLIRLVREYVNMAKPRGLKGPIKELKAFLEYAGEPTPKRRKRMTTLSNPQEHHEEEKEVGRPNGPLRISQHGE